MKHDKIQNGYKIKIVKHLITPRFTSRESKFHNLLFARWPGDIMDMHRFRKCLFLFFVLILLAINAPLSQAQHLNFRSYSAEDGLIQNVVNVIFQDREGFLWFGTDYGISRYDGFQFQQLELGGKFDQIRISAIAEDGNGTKFFSSLGRGLYRYEGKLVTNLRKDNGLISDSIQDIIVDDHNRLWIATNLGISIFDGKSFTNVTSADGLFVDFCSAVYKADNGDVLIGHPGGITKYDGTEFTVFLQFTDQVETIVNDILEDSDGIFWISTTEGLFTYDGQELKPVIPPGDFGHLDFSSAATDKRNHILFGTDNGAFHWDGSEFVHLTKVNGLINNNVLATMVDRENNVWFGTETGASKCNFHSFRFYDENHGLPDAFVRVICEDSLHRFWIGTRNGVALLDENLDPITNFVSEFPDGRIICITEVEKGVVMIGTRHGVFRSDGRTVRMIPPAEGEIPSDTRGICKDKNGRIWTGAFDGLHYLEGGRMHSVDKNHILANASVSAMTQAPDGRVWLAIDAGKVYVNTPEDFLNFQPFEAIEEDLIWHIFFDSRGNIWFGTNAHGAFMYDGKSMINYNTSNGLSDNTIWFIQEDSHGNLWFGTNRGLELFDGERFQKFNTRDGLAADEANAAACLLDSKNRLIFGSVGGLNVIDSSNEYLNPVEPMVSIQNVLVNNRRVDDLSQPLAPGENNITFEFVGLSFRDEDDVRYRYMLRGIDHAWSAPTSENQIRYSSLPPGNFTFVVYAANDTGLWSEKPAALSFSILPPFYSTLWFSGLVILSIMLLLVTVYRWRMSVINKERKKLELLVEERTRELAASNKELEMFCYSISHDLNSRINLIKGFCDVLLDQKMGLHEDEKLDFLHRINTSAISTMELFNAIMRLWQVINQKPEFVKVNLALLARVIQGELSKTNPDRQVTFIVPDELWVMGDAGLLRLALMNLISNAWKFTRNRDEATIELGSEIIGGSNVFFVRDNGTGFNMDYYEKLFIPFQRLHTEKEYAGLGMGLVITQKVIQRHNGKIWAESELDKGTTFYFTLHSE